MPNSSQDAENTKIITKDQNNQDHYHHCNISISSSSNNKSNNKSNEKKNNKHNIVQKSISRGVKRKTWVKAIQDLLGQ